jgi:hypothetical protein
MLRDERSQNTVQLTIKLKLKLKKKTKRDVTMDWNSEMPVLSISRNII